MVMTLNNPEAKASKKQLWLLHILTKQDTRKWELTMQQASDRISELKGNGNGKHKPSPKLDKQSKVQAQYASKNLTGYGMNLGTIKIVQAYKEVSKHGNDSICISVKASGIFPQGKKTHIITEFIKHENDVILTPLFAHIRHDVTVDRQQYHEWIKNLPVRLNNSKFNPIPESWHDRVIELAKQVDSYIDIIKVA